ncbi:hypothetical protein IEO21_02724 [Rhodonia placenta]|uniref:Uncharacterized protein n=1 Tax=Rhodonia placenta TaxID=104341 RepID=A0A8H7P7F0_9APHY|nr:hypothetical protein IEO21_02724 [Postia placenta]
MPHPHSRRALAHICVYLPTTAAQQARLEPLLAPSEPFAIRTLAGRCCPVRAEIVFVPTSDDTGEDAWNDHGSDPGDDGGADEVFHDADDGGARAEEDGDAETLAGDAAFARPPRLDAAWEYIFKRREPVWVRMLSGAWAPGVVADIPAHIGPARNDFVECVYYPVHYTYCPGRGRAHKTERRFFAPLNGDMKPDTPHCCDVKRQSAAVCRKCVGSRQGVFCVDRQGQSERGRSQPAAFGEQSAHLGVVGLDVAVEGGEVSPRVVAERDGEEQTLLLCAGGQIPARIPHHASRRAWEDTTSAVTSHWPCGHWQ